MIKRVQTKAINIENDEQIWPLENWICDVCRKGFKSNERLAKHVKNQRCPDCLKCFTSSSLKRSHILLINTIYSKCKNATFKCQVCTKVFKERKFLEKHKIKHVLKDEDPFSERILSIHQKQKQTYNIESVSCSKCHETFPTKDLMKTHKREYNCQVLVICDNCNNPVG